MKSIYALTLLATMASACGPNEFAFEQQSTGNGGPEEEVCRDGCANGENLLYDYTEVVPNDKNVDILFVDDDSGSMAQEQANMATRFPTFINSLSGVNWQVGITTTDVSSGGARGKLVTFEGSTLKVIDKTTPNADILFKNTIKMDEEGDGDERGIYASVLAMEANENSWVRANAHLAIVIISDENERSNGQNLENRDMPATLVSTVKSKFGQNKSFTAHSIVTKPNDSVCLNGAGESYGTVYAALSNLTGGVIGDICAADYGAQLAAIAQNIQNNFQALTLKCFPINGVVTVTYNPAPATPVTTVIDRDKLQFSRSIAAGTQVHLRYECTP